MRKTKAEMHNIIELVQRIDYPKFNIWVVRSISLMIPAAIISGAQGDDAIAWMIGIPWIMLLGTFSPSFAGVGKLIYTLLSVVAYIVALVIVIDSYYGALATMFYAVAVLKLIATIKDIVELVHPSSNTEYEN